MENLQSMTVRALRERARDLGITGRGTMNKAALLEAVARAEAEAASAQPVAAPEVEAAPVIEVAPVEDIAEPPIAPAVVAPPAPAAPSAPSSSRSPRPPRPAPEPPPAAPRHPLAGQPPLLAPLELADPPEAYGVDLVSVLPHGPRTAVVLWSLSAATQARLASGRADVRIVADDGAARSHPLDGAEGMWRVVDLPAGRAWRGEIWAGATLVLAGAATQLPPEGVVESTTPRVVEVDPSEPMASWPADLRVVARTPAAAPASPLPAWAAPAAAPARPTPSSSRG
jgi:hypothetical protein